MKKNIIFILLTTFIIIIGYFLNNYSPKEDLNNYTILEKIIEGDSMTPMLKSGQRVYLIVDYYKKNSPKVGDIVAYDFGGGIHPYIKQVKATSSDNLEIVGNMLYINGSKMKNSAGETYIFTKGEIKMLSMYIHDGHIPEGSYFIFGDNTKESIDSRKFGAVSANNFYGKFVLGK